MPHRSRRYCGEQPNSATIRISESFRSAASANCFHSSVAAQQPDAILVRRFRRFQPLARLPRIPRRAKRRRPGASASAMLIVLPSGPAKFLQIRFRKTVEQALHLARQTDQRVPCAVHREIVAARINHCDLAPELGHGAQHFQLAREKLLVHHRKLDVLLDRLRAADANAEIIDVAAQHSPGCRPAARCPSAPVEAGSRPSSLGAAWRANGSASATTRRVSTSCFPSPIRIRPGVSGDHAADSAWRIFIPSCPAKYSCASMLEGAGAASNPAAFSGVPRRCSICSFRRRRTSLQSPRFSVTLHSSFSDPSLSAAISAPAASRNASAPGARLLRQHHQKLAAAARSEQHFRQSQLGQQRARQHFAEQADPVRAPGEDLIAIAFRWRQQKFVDPEKLPLKEYLHGHFVWAKSSL